MTISICNDCAEKLRKILEKFSPVPPNSVVDVDLPKDLCDECKEKLKGRQLQVIGSKSPMTKSLSFPGGSVPMPATKTLDSSDGRLPIVPSGESPWEAQVYEWRKWALRELGRTTKDYQQASDNELRSALGNLARGIRKALTNP